MVKDKTCAEEETGTCLECGGSDFRKQKHYGMGYEGTVMYQCNKCGYCWNVREVVKDA